ncbi:tyrosine-type recombinase/integrase [Rhodoligotrophos defluvii]|uniref:tyrosine-type recombinase/integrase n=1 Tax=Rhodoligotrophos defluvii TaxID=2561934 RepID=UPI0010CA1EE7|nr:site-specific integrase [Rhodoligotrophos defluvii]
MRKKLTPKTIEALPPAKGKRYEVWDELLPGFIVRVSSKGRKTWHLCARINKRRRRIKIGDYPILTLGEAREKARSIMRAAQLGRYVEKAETEDESGASTLGELVPQFIEFYAKPRNKDWKGSERILLKFSSLYSRPIDQIKRAEVVRVIDTILANGTPYRANRALAAIKKLFAWCLDRGTIEVNPTAALKLPTKEVARDRVLNDRELVVCWKAAEAEGFPFDKFTHMLILTGQRRGEVAGMRWSEIDFERAMWTIPAQRTKNGTQHTVPLAPHAVQILQAVPRFLNSDLVFTTSGKTPISGFGRHKARLDAEVGASDWRFHDIRRTVATNMAMMRVPPHVIEAILNHKTGIVSGVAAVYNRHAYLEEKREALEQWAGRIAELISKEASSRDASANSASLTNKGMVVSLPTGTS